MKNIDKKISVILPTYNGAAYISKSIDSVINQSYENWELIIVNDCSTDNTLEIINGYAERDTRIRIISNEENKKLPASLNVGFSAATGEYLTWTSDDNAYHNDALGVLVDELNRYPLIDLVYSDFDIVDSGGNLKEHYCEPEPEELKYNNVVGACFLYRRSLAQKIGVYDTGLFLAEDYEYWIRAYLNGTLKHINKSMYDYAMHDKSLTSTRLMEIQKATFLAKEKHFDELLSRCRTQEERNRFFDEMLGRLVNRDEFKKYRRQYYSLDKQYVVFDIKRRMRNSKDYRINLIKKKIKALLSIHE